MSLYLLLLVATALWVSGTHAYGGPQPTKLASLPALGIDIDSLSVSGISSGGAMAIQLHVAHR
jgi:hypothetical protein